MTEAKAWENYALHLAHCGLCASSTVHCSSGQAARNECFDGNFALPPRDPELRRAALEALRGWDVLGARLLDALAAAVRGDSAGVKVFTDGDAVGKARMAMDALREALAR